MTSLETIVLIGALVVVGAVLAPRLRIAPPLLMLVLGVLAGFAPPVQTLQLPSEAVLVLFLPALLFWESLTTSLREIRRDLRGILLLSTVLVVATAFGVAGLAAALGLTWGAALILGAALAPTDATAVGAMARTLPHRNMTVLRAESLINDGTALVIFSIALGIGVSQLVYTGWEIAGMVAVAYIGGGIIGVVFAALGTMLLRRVADSIANNAVLVVVPFAAFLCAELVEASGVIAVVAAGLLLSQSGPRVSTPQSRQQTFAFWSLGTFFLNNALFVLVGIEAQIAVRAVPVESLGPLVVITVLAWIATLAIRYVFQVATVFVIRMVDRRPSQKSRRMPHRARVVSTVAGFRGAVSLAVALAVPTTLASGEPFPGRDEIVFITAGVVLLTLLVQGALLPGLVRWARLPVDGQLDKELHFAEREAIEEALRRLPGLVAELKVGDAVASHVAELYRRHSEMLASATSQEGADQGPDEDRQGAVLRLALIESKRDVMIRLRDRGAISDTTLRTLQSRLDRESLRLSQPELLE